VAGGCPCVTTPPETIGTWDVNVAANQKSSGRYSGRYVVGAGLAKISVTVIPSGHFVAANGLMLKL
jgi:hypothetical protein